ncbi:MAG: exopolysaccharide transport family protein [Beijerinckiaceae bacterium]|nr:exopolysaccharide transport family protein [Beijerinckiaceae bacterium]
MPPLQQPSIEAGMSVNGMQGMAVADRRKPAEAIELSEIFSILARRLWIILIVAALFVVPAVLYILTAPSLYSATTSILIDPRQGRSLSVETAANLSADTGQLESQLKLVSSQTVLRRVVENEKLLNDEEFGPQPPGLLRRILGVVGRNLPAPSQQDKIDLAVDALSKNVSARRSERTYVIDIQVSSKDAAKSARLANAVAKAYMDDASEARSGVVKLESDYVREQLSALQTKLQEAEERVAIFKEKNRIFDASGKLVNDEQITNLSNEIVQARTKTAEARAKFEQVQRAVKSGKSVETVGDAQKSATLDKLRAQGAEIARLEANLRTTLGPLHPQLREVQQQAADTRRLINEELRRIVGLTENEYQVARSSEQSLEAELERLRAIAGTTNQALPQLRELERNVDAQRAAFDKLSKTGDTISQQGADTPIARVIATALTPDVPSSPRKIPILALALTGGLGFGVGAALLTESAARRKRVPRTPTPARPVARSARWLRLFDRAKWLRGGWRKRSVPLRGNGANEQVMRIPASPPQGSASFFESALQSRQSAFKDAVKTLVAAELLGTPFDASASSPTHATRFVFVTSLDPSVGKSVLVANAAAIGAEMGARILVVDANLVNPTLSIEAADAGQLGLIPAMGRLRPAFAIERGGNRFYILSASDGDEATAGRLSQVLPQFLTDEVDRNFDLVLIDGASLSAMSGADEFAASSDRIWLVGHADVEDAAVMDMTAKALGCERALIRAVSVQTGGRGS